jgi:RNA polymerase sigma-70 factor, ECF subfamily
MEEELIKKKIMSDLVDQYGQSINRLVYTYVKNSHETEDLTQDIFVKCYQKLDQFSGDSSYSTWLYRIAVNHCKDYIRVHTLRRAKKSIIEQFTRSYPQTTEELVINKSRQNELIHLVLELPEKYRAPIYLHYIEDKPISDVMEILGLSKNTVYTRLRRGLDKLKKLYDLEGMSFCGYSKGIEGNY